MNIRMIKDIFIPPAPFADPVLNESSDFFEINNWTISEFVVKRLVPLVGCHPFPLNEQILMTAAVCRVRPSHILEWGTNIGASARIFHEIRKAFSLNIEIHTTDLPDHEMHEEHPGRQRGRLVRGIPDVNLHQGDGLDVSLGIVEAFPKPVKAFFFLDGDHSYDSVSRELKKIIGQVPSASILVHDTFCQSSESGYNTGPYCAIQDVLRETGALYDTNSQNLGLPGMTFLWKRI